MAVQEFEDAVIIDGSQDVVQLEVQGHSTQTEPLQEWQDSSGTVLAEVTENGHFHTGDLTMGAPAALIEANESISMPSSDVKQGLQSRGEFTGSVSESLTWGVQELEFTGSGGVSSVQSAVRGKVTHGNSGDSSMAELRAGDFEAVNETGSSGDPVGQATGLHAAASNESGAYLAKAIGVEATINNENTGDIAEAAAFEVASPINDGTIDTLVGLKVNDIDQGTDNYAIQTGDGIVQLGDVVELAEQGSAPATPDAGMVRIYPKSDKKLYAKNSDGTEYDLTASGGGGSAEDYILIRDKKTAGTDGGTFTAGAWRTRDLNEEVVDTGGDASLSSNQITLEAGTYRCRISCPGGEIGIHQARLRDTTGSTTLLHGTSELTDYVVITRSEIVGRFTLSTQSVLEVQHQCDVTQSTNGFGYAVDFGTEEIYTIAEFWKES